MAAHSSPLEKIHRRLGAKMVPFAGWNLPLRYSALPSQSVAHTRSRCSLFDVSHMEQTKFFGRDRRAFLEKLTCANVLGLGQGRCVLTLLLNDGGGIDDDMIIANHADFVHVVNNAANSALALRRYEELLAQERGKGAQVVMEREPRALIAIQGPTAREVIRRLIPGDVAIDRWAFMKAMAFPLGGDSEFLVTRCGYTGEDGFEISIPVECAEAFADKLLDHEEVQPAGLIARDILRIEAGLNLHGHEMDASTSPGETGMNWAVAKKRREAHDFPGAARICAEGATGSQRERVGLQGQDVRRIMRYGDELLVDGSVVGLVTSGTFSPTIEASVGIGRAKRGAVKEGQEVLVRGKTHEFGATVCALPFVPSRFFRVQKQ